MTNPEPDSIATLPAGAGGAPSPGAPTAGELLRRGREAAGLSLDAVAQQLKLAPRQVAALEQNDFARLPGRTFIRGFVRNYARLVRIDADTVLGALAGSEAPSLDTPPLHPTAPTMGELPTHENGKPAWTLWAIPLTLVAIIAAAAIYEFSRGHGEAPRLPAPAKGAPAAESPAPAPAPSSSPAPAAGDAPLANPIAAAPAGSAPGPDRAAAPASAAAAAPGTPAAETATAAASAPPAAAPPSGTIAPAPAAALVVGSRGKSWVEVKDAAGRVLLSQTLTAGQSASVTGTPPLTAVIGNANDARLEFRGRAVDLAPHIQKNIARLTLE